MARIVFMGTPEYAKRILARAVEAGGRYLVVIKPDVPLGRRRWVTPSPVAAWSEAAGLTVLKPERLRDAVDQLAAFEPDYVLTAAFGRILRPWLLEMPRFGAYNLHASLLPRWRGPNPIAWAIRAGDAVTGVTLMQMDAGIDTGPIVAQTTVPIGEADTTGTLTEKLADRAADLWLGALTGHEGAVFPQTPQPADGVTLAPKFSADETRLDWSQPAGVLERWIRSMLPDPGPYAMLEDERIKILEVFSTDARSDEPPGWARLDKEDWVVACGGGALGIRTIQPAGRRPMTPGAFLRGRRGGLLCQLR